MLVLSGKWVLKLFYQDLAIVPNMTAPLQPFPRQNSEKIWDFCRREANAGTKREKCLQNSKVETVQSLKRPISEMSGGQQQSIAIGRAIAWEKRLSSLMSLQQPWGRMKHSRWKE